MAITLDGDARATISKLDAIRDSSTDVDDDTKKMAINMGHEAVQQHLASALSSSSLLRRIELNLAAHYLSVTYDKEAGDISAGDISADFMVEGGQNFSATGYGQTAISLDPSGNLKEASEGQNKAVTVGSVSGGADD